MSETKETKETKKVTETVKPKETSRVIQGTEIALPLLKEMTIERFTELYGEKFGDQTKAHYASLKAVK